ncbi:hypothetical protein SAMN04515666_108145 [Bosea lupini]|uniref:Uncharacterized protein n=1 Tax=Bosea lupini TaxID=1036779 RepID=A0A1H7WEV1_9HYPH|nr:hypothetical protein SAMN04515666_108145 [Bosea lupini]
MCNLYSHTRGVEAMRKLFAPFNDGPEPGQPAAAAGHLS